MSEKKYRKCSYATVLFHHWLLDCLDMSLIRLKFDILSCILHSVHDNVSSSINFMLK